MYSRLLAVGLAPRPPAGDPHHAPDRPHLLPVVGGSIALLLAKFTALGHVLAPRPLRLDDEAHLLLLALNHVPALAHVRPSHVSAVRDHHRSLLPRQGGTPMLIKGEGREIGIVGVPRPRPRGDVGCLHLTARPHAPLLVAILGGDERGLAGAEVGVRVLPEIGTGGAAFLPDIRGEGDHRHRHRRGGRRRGVRLLQVEGMRGAEADAEEAGAGRIGWTSMPSPPVEEKDEN